MTAPVVRIVYRPRHHLALIVAIPLMLSGLLVLLIAAPAWRGWPTATNTYALFPFVFGAPLLAALQAYESARTEESQLSSWVVRTARVKVRENSRSLTGSLIAAAACAIVWFAAARIATLIAPLGRAAGSIRPMLGYVAMTVLVIALGHLIGKIHANLVVIIALAFVVAVVVSIFTTQFANTSPASVLTPLPLNVLGVAAVLAAVAALLAPVAQRSSRGWTSAAIAGVLAAGPVLVGATSQELLLEPSLDPVCSGQRPQICVWQEHEAALPLLVAISRDVADVVPEVMDVPDQVYEFGLDARGCLMFCVRDPE